jgi:hypothetical protein
MMTCYLSHVYPMVHCSVLTYAHKLNRKICQFDKWIGLTKHYIVLYFDDSDNGDDDGGLNFYVSSYLPLCRTLDTVVADSQFD